MKTFRGGAQRPFCVARLIHSRWIFCRRWSVGCSMMRSRAVAQALEQRCGAGPYCRRIEASLDMDTRRLQRAVLEIV